MLQMSSKQKRMENCQEYLHSVGGKGFYNKPEDVSKKLLSAFIELGEASDT